MTKWPLLDDSAELAATLFHWFTQQRAWTNVEGILIRIVFAAFVIATLLWLVEKVVSFFAKLVKGWKDLGFRIRQPKEEIIAIRNRRQFCSILQSDLATIAKAENWNDQWFTDLEAEVEIEGRYYAGWFDRLLRKVSSGVRRLPSLMDAIEESTDDFLIVVGPPGSGKSVALRHLGAQLAQRGARSKAVDVPIPLYINLKELPEPPLNGPR